MSFRVLTINLEQHHKRWGKRRELVVRELKRIKPDLVALNEVSVPNETGRWLQRSMAERFGIQYALFQQSKVNAASELEAEALLTRFRVIESGNLDLRLQDSVAQVVRVEIEGQVLDLYVTHLLKSVAPDPVRREQVKRLLDWVSRRDDVAARIICGDFNATLDMPSMQLMSRSFRPTQALPTAFTPLQGEDGSVSHPEWTRFDRCIDYIWITERVQTRSGGVCFDRPADDDPTLWPSDHLGVWAELDFAGK
jgi:endonuclease/exonuclease/phosphatase family metal-dependent hydrolase